MRDVIQKIKTQYNIVDYIRTNGVELTSSGVGTYKGLCPFHNEKTPSFSVSEDFQNYRCFGCGASGDIIQFAQETHTISFMEAVEMLAAEKGIEIKKTGNETAKHNIAGIRAVAKDAQEFYRYQYQILNENHPAKKEIAKRGLKLDNELYGYALETPNDLYKFLKEKGHSDKDIKDSNLVIFFDDNRDPWDFFHGRLMITLSDYIGRPVTFTARKIYDGDKMPGKYVNGKDSPIFHKKTNLFGADKAKKSAREKGEVIVVEGQFDQISLQENGVENVVATSGTAFTSEHANLLRRMVGENGKIIFVMDGDEAGIEAAIKVFTSEPSLHSQAYAVHLHKGTDPCDYIQNGRLDELLRLVAVAPTLDNFVVDKTLEKYGTLDGNNRQSFVNDVARYAKSATDGYIIDGMLSKASILSAISINNVKEIYNKVEVAKRYTQETKPTVEEPKPTLIQLNKDSEADMLMFSALALLILDPETLITHTPKLVHNKFKPFMRDLGQAYKRTKEQQAPWRFIPEDYEDDNFARLLQSKEHLIDPREDMESFVAQYEFLFNKANAIYHAEAERIRKARALSSVVDSTDPKEIAKALELYKN